MYCVKGKTRGCEADICCLAYRGGASDASDDFHEPLTNEPSASADSGARQRGGHEFTLENRTAEEKTMNEEMNKQQEAEVKAEAPVETMEDYAAELEASYKAFDERHFELPETDDAEGEKWAEFAQMMADRTVLNVKIAEAVKGGVVAFVNEVRAFIPASQLSTEYVEKLEDWQGKHVDAVIITVDPEKKRLVLSGREVEKEKKAAQRKERLAQFKAGDVVEGTVDNIKDYGAFVKLADGIDGLLHISQISTQRIKHPGAVLKEGQTVKVKILSIADGKISLSMKALIEQETEEEEHETFDYKETAAATTGLGDLLKGLKL